MQGSDNEFQPATWFLWPMQLATRALANLGLAPEALTQAINPWSAVININSNNSSSRATELAVLTKYSYGRQLGRLNDVVALLVERVDEARRPLSADERTAIGEFETMKLEVDVLKLEAARARVDRVVAEVEQLERSDPAAFEELVQRLRRLLGAAADVPSRRLEG